MSRSETGWTSADDCHPLRVDARCLVDGFPAVSQGVINHEAFERHNTHRLIDHPAGAFALAWVVAGSTADTREGIVFFDHPQGFPVASLGDQRNVTLGALLCWTGVPAGSRP